MIAESRGRDVARTGAIWSLASLLGLASVGMAQAPRGGQAPARSGRAVVAPATAPRPAEKPVVEIKPVPVNPSDPIALVNGEVITRQQLADECVARKGEEILETLIARSLIEQALRKNKVEVTEAEIFAEIDRIASSMAGVSREQWLRTLAKERNISPAQYARDVIYPALALRKLATPRVQITKDDMKEAYEAQFGEKLIYRMIMCSSLDHAKQVWEEVRKNPAGFEHVAMNDPRSIDPATRSTGGKPVNGPLQRHSYPRQVTDKIFLQLVDGDPDDTKAEHKPKDGDISGPIEVAEGAWVIVKREGLIPATEYDPEDPKLAEQIRQAIFDSKLQQHMEQVYNEALGTAKVENKLTGTVKDPNTPPTALIADPDVTKVNATGTPVTSPAGATISASSNASAPAPLPNLPPPASVSSSEIEALEKSKVAPPSSPK